LVIAGTFKTRSAASKRVDALGAKGVTGFVVTSHVNKPGNHTVFRVQQPFATRRAALAEAKKVRAAGFRAHILRG